MQIIPTTFTTATSGPSIGDSALDVSPAIDVEPVIVVPVEAPRTVAKPIALETEILAVFGQTAADGESRELLFKRKEHQLAALFAQLVPAESLALEERLRIAHPDDQIAVQFGRLIGARQTRLLAHLAASRKRHPLQLARRSAG
jgi:hypothetical protein